MKNMGLLSAKVAGSSDGQSTETSLLLANVNQIFAAYNLFSACTEMPAVFYKRKARKNHGNYEKVYTNDTIEKMYTFFTYLQGRQRRK